MKLIIQLDSNAEYDRATGFREHLLQVLDPEFYDVLPIEVRDAPMMNHGYMPDGRGPAFDEDVCVQKLRTGMCGQPRSAHAR